MTNENPEEILRKAPKPRPPEDLLVRLKADLRRERNNQANAPTWGATPWFRRWLPLFGTAMILLGCAAVVVAQTSSFSALKKANLSLRAKVAKLESSESDSLEIQRLAVENQELDRLRKDHEEVLQLREEITKLQLLSPVIARLRIENKELAAQLAGRRDSESGEEFFARVGGMDVAREKAFRIKCVNNLKNLGLAARIWGTDHGDAVPSSFLEMKNEIATPKLLICPSDTAHQVAEDWDHFGPSQSSYEFLSPSTGAFNPEVVLFRCPIHNNVTLGDGSVQQLPPTVQVVFKDDKWLLERQ